MIFSCGPQIRLSTLSSASINYPIVPALNLRLSAVICCAYLRFQSHRLTAPNEWHSTLGIDHSTSLFHLPKPTVAFRSSPVLPSVAFCRLPSPEAIGNLRKARVAYGSKNRIFHFNRYDGTLWSSNVVQKASESLRPPNRPPRKASDSRGQIRTGPRLSESFRTDLNLSEQKFNFQIDRD